ncbi:unnamed protein product [Polarella glacialis]|uniref:Uncharacterized protein n=1 Tax=Polarella glacialis TaxID=89957 RepID=A0A813EPV7_POLGL|nr:unnamed protein product [Polarella glacialis]
MFKEYQEILRGLHNEVEEMKRTIVENNENLREDIAELGAEIDEESYERREALDSIRYTWTAPIRRKTRKMIQEMDEIVKHQALKDADKNRQFDQAAEEVDRIKNDLLPVSAQWSKSVAKLREPTAISAVMKGRAS